MVLTHCPQCGDVTRHPRYVADAYRCRSCDAAREVAVVGDGGRRHPLYTQDGLYAALSDIAERRNGQVGRRYLGEERPELLANCQVHAGNYRNARRRLRRWLGRHRGDPPTIAEPTFPFWSGAQDPGPGTGEPRVVIRGRSASASGERIAAIALKVATRTPTTEDRCPYCRDVFEDADQDGEPDHAFLCACKALFHVECRIELDRCTTIGCTHPFDIAEATGGPMPEGDDDEAPEIVVTETGSEASTERAVLLYVAAVVVALVLTWFAVHVGKQERRVFWPLAICAWIYVGVRGLSSD